MRLDGVKRAEGGMVVRILFWFLRRRHVRIPAPIRVYAYRPAILWSFLRLARVVRRRGALSPRLKGLAMYWTARTVECAY